MATISPAIRVATVAVASAGVGYAAYHKRFPLASSIVYAETPAQYTNEVSQSSAAHDSNSDLSKMQWKGFTELKLAKSEQVSPNVKRLTFSLPTDTTIAGLEPVSSMITQHTPEGAWIPVFRPYTPMSPPTQPGTVEFLIKKYPDGRASGKMHSLKTGDTMKFRPLPAVEYPYKANEHSDILMIAGGSGITPIWQLISVILNNPDDKTKIALVYANNSEEDILLRHEIENLEHKYPTRFRKVFTVSRGTGSEEEKHNKEVYRGHVDQGVIHKVWSQQRSEGQKVLVSGPPAMVDSVAGKKGLMGMTQGSIGGLLAQMGYQTGDVHKF